MNVELPADVQSEQPFFSVTHESQWSLARTGVLTTDHGVAETPCFLPIASHGTLRAMSFEQAGKCGTKIIMANAWHIFRDVDPEELSASGGIHRVMGWPGILMTDSGGYQVFSLRDDMELTDEGVRFGELEDEILTAQRVIHIQKKLGSDIMLVLDDCAPFPCPKERIREAVRRTTLWARQSLQAHGEMPARYNHRQFLFGIVQGSTNVNERLRSIDEISDLGFDGFGIGGLSIGMPRKMIREMTALTCEHLPEDKPRHLLGVGLPHQIMQGIADGADTFDCVLPIRKGQRGTAYARTGEVLYKKKQPAGKQDLPLDVDCVCPTCATYSREQMRQLFLNNKPAAGELAAVHNITFFHHVLSEARQAIREDRFETYLDAFLDDWKS